MQCTYLTVSTLFSVPSQCTTKRMVTSCPLPGRASSCRATRTASTSTTGQNTNHSRTKQECQNEENTDARVLHGCDRSKQCNIYVSKMNKFPYSLHFHVLIQTPFHLSDLSMSMTAQRSLATGVLGCRYGLLQVGQEVLASLPAQDLQAECPFSQRITGLRASSGMRVDFYKFDGLYCNRRCQLYKLRLKIEPTSTIRPHTCSIK